MTSNRLMNHHLPNILFLPRRRPPPKDVRPLLLHALIRLDEVAQEVSLGGGDDASVDVGAGTEIVEDTGRDGGRDERECFLALYVRTCRTTRRATCK